MKNKKRNIMILTISILILIMIYTNPLGDKRKDSKNIFKHWHDEYVVQKVNKKFNSIMDLYPTPNIENLADESKGSRLILRTDINIKQPTEPKTPLKSEGMILYLNTNTKKGYGYYYIDKFYEESALDDKEEKYPVYYDKGIHLRQSTGDLEFDKKIENFQFLVQYADFHHLNKNKLVETSYDSNFLSTGNPSFSIKYQLNNNDPLIQKLNKEYYLTSKQDPILCLDGSKNYGENVQVSFSKKTSKYIDSSITYDNHWKEEFLFWAEEKRLSENEDNLSQTE